MKGTNESHYFFCEQERLTYSFLCRQGLERPFVTLCFQYHVYDHVKLLHSLHSTGTVCMHAFRQTLPLYEGAGTQTNLNTPLDWRSFSISYPKVLAAESPTFIQSASLCQHDNYIHEVLAC